MWRLPWPFVECEGVMSAVLRVGSCSMYIYKAFRPKKRCRMQPEDFELPR